MPLKGKFGFGHHMGSVSGRGLTVGEWLNEKNRRYGGGYTFAKSRGQKAAERRQSQITAPKGALTLLLLTAFSGMFTRRSAK